MHPFWSSQVFWIAVSAIATVGYLAASFALWRTAAANAKATRELIGLNQKMVEATAKQAKVAEQQFEQSRQAFIQEMRPVVWFKQAYMQPFRGGVAENGLVCHFTLRNAGRTPAKELSWNLSITTDKGVMGSPASKPQSECPVELVPDSEWPQEVMLGDPYLLNNMRSFHRVDVLVEVAYKSAVDGHQYLTLCTVRYEPMLGKTSLISTQTG
jgi:hypothetical protein